MILIDKRKFAPQALTKPLALIGLLVFALSGCANPYRTHFVSVIDRYPIPLQNSLKSLEGKSKLYLTNDMKTDSHSMFKNGYVLMGYSRFNLPSVDSDEALSEAQRMGADVVLLEKKYAHTFSETVPYSYYTNPKTTTIQERSQRIQGDKIEVRNKHVEITTGGDLVTIFMQKQTEYYKQSATFWKKWDRPIFGAYVKDLESEDISLIQSNRGLKVHTIMKGSPSFNADVLVGDIITQVNGKPAPLARDFYSWAIQQAGMPIQLKILRNNKIINIAMNLGK